MDTANSSKPASVIGVDLAKRRLAVAGFDEDRKTVLRQPRASRRKLFEKLANMPPFALTSNANPRQQEPELKIASEDSLGRKARARCPDRIPRPHRRRWSVL